MGVTLPSRLDGEDTNFHHLECCLETISQLVLSKFPLNTFHNIPLGVKANFLVLVLGFDEQHLNLSEPTLSHVSGVLTSESPTLAT